MFSWVCCHWRHLPEMSQWLQRMWTVRRNNFVWHSLSCLLHKMLRHSKATSWWSLLRWMPNRFLSCCQRRFKIPWRITRMPWRCLRVNFNSDKKSSYGEHRSPKENLGFLRLVPMHHPPYDSLLGRPILLEDRKVRPWKKWDSHANMQWPWVC